MPPSQRQIDREYDALERELAEGTITQAEYRKAIREMERDLRGAMEEEAEQAAQRVRDEWGY